MLQSFPLSVRLYAFRARAARAKALATHRKYLKMPAPLRLIVQRAAHAPWARPRGRAQGFPSDAGRLEVNHHVRVSVPRREHGWSPRPLLELGAVELGAAQDVTVLPAAHQYTVGDDARRMVHSA